MLDISHNFDFQFFVCDVRVLDKPGHFPQRSFGEECFFVSCPYPSTRSSKTVWTSSRCGLAPARNFRSSRLEMRVVLISCPPPRHTLQRQSLDLWPGQRWPQYDVTFAVWSLTLLRFSSCSFQEIFFVHFSLSCLSHCGPDFRSKVWTFSRPGASNCTH